MSAMDVSNGNQLQLAVSVPSPSYDEMLEAQRELFHSQIGELQNIVLTQCELTGVNPLSQEMAAGALSIKIGKRPRDLLNPKAVKYMQSVFSIKDTITKKESREISALFGVTVTQVREFFMSQRSRVRKFVRVARQKAVIADASNEVQDGTPISMEAEVPIYPVPLNCVGPSGSEVPSCPTPYESLPDLDDSDKYFVENIFAFMRKEETFSGQVTLMDWIMQIHNSSLLFWFLTRGGVMVLATWLSQAATEELTSVLHVILKVLCHLPLNKALPEHMSAILHSVNRLRFYPSSDISNRARSLLSKWSKLFARSQAMKKPNAMKSTVDTHNELLLKRSIDEIMGHDSWEAKNDCHEDALALSLDNSENNIRKLESPQPLKLLPASAEDYSKKFIRGVSSSRILMNSIGVFLKFGRTSSFSVPEIEQTTNETHLSVFLYFKSKIQNPVNNKVKICQCDQDLGVSYPCQAVSGVPCISRYFSKDLNNGTGRRNGNGLLKNVLKMQTRYF